MPLTWAQLHDGLDPRRFTIHTVSKLLKRSAAWKAWQSALAQRHNFKRQESSLAGNTAGRRAFAVRNSCSE
jgi:DNA primase